MAQTFHITPAATFAQLDATGAGKVAFTITNATAKPLRAWPEIKPLGSTQREWLTVEGQAERSFSANEAHTFTVAIQAPPGASAGTYEFKLNVINADKADVDGCTEGPTVKFQVEAAAPPPPPRKWLWIAAAALVVLVGVTAAVLLSDGKAVELPTLENKLLSEVEEDLRAKGIEYEVVERRVTPDGSKPAGFIFEQSPKPGEILAPGAKAQLKIETVSVLVPRLTGGNLAQAIGKAHPLNLLLKPPQSRVDPGNLDKIVDQIPKPDTRVAAGTEIDVWLGVPTPTSRPNFDVIVFEQLKAKAAIKKTVREGELKGWKR